jgi:hypothetical protein
MTDVTRPRLTTLDKAGQAPATLHAAPSGVAPDAEFHLLAYGADSFEERSIASISDAVPIAAPPTVTGPRGVGSPHADTLQQIGAQRWGYPLVWAVMAAIVLAMLAYFRKKKWL